MYVETVTNTKFEKKKIRLDVICTMYLLIIIVNIYIVQILSKHKKLATYISI